jgi:transposase
MWRRGVSAAHETRFVQPSGATGATVPDGLWLPREPLLPPEPPKPNGGCAWIPDRRYFPGIHFVLRHGLPWEDPPYELGCGSGMTCWLRVRDRQAAVV